MANQEFKGIKKAAQQRIENLKATPHKDEAVEKITKKW